MTRTLSKAISGVRDKVPGWGVDVGSERDLPEEGDLPQADIWWWREGRALWRRAGEEQNTARDRPWHRESGRECCHGETA